MNHYERHESFLQPIKLNTVLLISALALSACSPSPESENCDHHGKEITRGQSFDEVRQETVELIAPNGSSEVIRGEHDGIVFDVLNANGNPVDGYIASYVDPSDSWKVNRALSCPG